MVGKDLIMATLFGSGGGSSGSGGGGWPEVPDDGATYLYITLAEGRTSPMLGVGVNGTVTVDWGDGTEPDVLTGTNVDTTQWTPNHSYAAPGNYVIRLVVDGEMALRGSSSSYQYTYILRYATVKDARNVVYQSALKRVKIGSSVSIQSNALQYCYSLASVHITGGAQSIGNYAFAYCHSLSSVTIPDGVTSISGYAFYYCHSLSSVTIPGSVETIASCAFYNCYGVAYYDFTHHTAVPTLSSTDVFTGIPADCEIRVPAALYDEWIAATNWATYASYIKAY